MAPVVFVFLDDLGILDDVAINSRPLQGRGLLAAAPRTKLQFSISAVFALLILPALSAVIAFSYYENVRNLSEVAQRSIDRARDDAITMGCQLFRTRRRDIAARSGGCFGASRVFPNPRQPGHPLCSIDLGPANRRGLHQLRGRVPPCRNPHG